MIEPDDGATVFRAGAGPRESLRMGGMLGPSLLFLKLLMKMKKKWDHPAKVNSCQ
jgi:hypothetical protein